METQIGSGSVRVDYILDEPSIGPEGGDGGGMVIAQGTPKEIAANPNSYTGKYLKKHLKIF